MPSHQTLASYLPESMLIKLSPTVSLLDNAGNLVGFRDALTFSYFFHEYVHYLHNISTVSGISAFINTIELWRNFRATFDDAGESAGSETLEPAQRDHLRTLSAYLVGARRSDSPTTNIVRPTGLRITSLCPEARVTGRQGEILTTIVCDAELSDGSNTERCVIRIGTLELLECAAWLLERRVAKAVDASVSVDAPPIIPYRVAEAAIEYAAPGLSEEAVICCVLAALQSSDAPDGMMQIIGVATNAIRDSRDPIVLVRAAALEALKQALAPTERWFADIEAEFGGNGILAVTVRRIIATAREALHLRMADPFFELTLVESMKADPDAFAETIRRIAPCAALQGRAGPDDDISRDILFSFTPPAKAGEVDPEEGLRVAHSIFHFVGCHRTLEGFVPQSKARHSSCPFYACCDLKLRQSDPQICKHTPWHSADWAGWNGRTCWYGTGVRATRPPKT